MRVVRRVGELTGLTPVELPEFAQAGVAMARDGRVVGVAGVALGVSDFPLAQVQALRDFAAGGLAARAVVAVRSGVFVKEVGHPVIDGWIALGRVSYDKQTMRRLCDADVGWFA